MLPSVRLHEPYICPVPRPLSPFCCRACSLALTDLSSFEVSRKLNLHFDQQSSALRHSYCQLPMMLKLATASLLLLLSSSCNAFRLPVVSQELLQMAQDVEVTLLTVSVHQDHGQCRNTAELTVSVVAGGADLQNLGSTAQQEVQQ